MKYVKDKLVEYSFSVSEFGHLLGIDRSYLHKLLNKKHKPTPRTIRTIAQGLQRLDKQDWLVHVKNIKKDM